LVALVGLGLAASVVPQPARAALPPTACSSLALQVCAAVNAQSQFTGGKWHLVLSVWNLFGNSASSGLSHVMTFVGIGSSAFTGTATLAGAKFNGSTITTWKQAKSINNNPVGAELDVAALGQQGINYGLVGCDQPIPPGLYPTCYSSGAYLELDFATSMQFDLNDPTAVYGWHSQAVNGTDCSLWVSSDGHQTAADASCANVVPEPVTMLLLGTGLAGMGGAGLVRRRKKNGDIENA
jgi:hypothetical protein